MRVWLILSLLQLASLVYAVWYLAATVAADSLCPCVAGLSSGFRLCLYSGDGALFSLPMERHSERAMLSESVHSSGQQNTPAVGGARRVNTLRSRQRHRPKGRCSGSRLSVYFQQLHAQRQKEMEEKSIPILLDIGGRRLGSTLLPGRLPLLRTSCGMIGPG